MLVSDLRLVCFELHRQEFALPIAHVRETLAMQPITRVFLTPSCLAGVFNLRGEIVPAIDLGPLFGLQRASISDESRLVILKHEAGVAGIIVDRLFEQRRLEEAVAPPPPNLDPAVAGLLLGIANTPDGIVRVLDVQAILSVEALRELAGRAS
ncbi:MAG: purine-binding chemotaxis protein CheW [Myxococcales bacterium]|nr:purine-binding chemotaxis protein CheW [Myxococcales bacterium]